MKQKKAVMILLVIFAIVGIIFAILGGRLLQSAIKLQKTAIKTEAVITDIETKRDSDGDITHTVYVEFDANGETYYGKSNFYHSGMHIGEKTTVYYNPKDPNHFTGSGNIFGSVMFVIIGSIFVAIGFGGLLNGVCKTNTKKKLRENGEKIYADFDHVEVNDMFEMNGKNPFVVICQYIHPNGENMEFKSENLWENPTEKIEQNDIKKFPVYVDLENPKKYYLSLEEITTK